MHVGGVAVVGEREAAMDGLASHVGSTVRGMSNHSEHIAKIEQTSLGWEDHGILSAQIWVTYGSSGQGIGGYAFDATLQRDGGVYLINESRVSSATWIGRVGCAYGMEWIARFMRACGVESWENLVGRTIVVLKDGDDYNASVVGVKPLPTEKGEQFIYADLRSEMDEIGLV